MVINGCTSHEVNVTAGYAPSIFPIYPSKTTTRGGRRSTARPASIRKGPHEARSGLERYLTEAGPGIAIVASQARRSTRIAWWFAGAGWSCALAVAMALMLLMPLKRVERSSCGSTTARASSMSCLYTPDTHAWKNPSRATF